eukprot:3645569-Pleurochrysis_carterae.AAC.1
MQVLLAHMQVLLAHMQVFFAHLQVLVAHMQMLLAHMQVFVAYMQVLLTCKCESAIASTSRPVRLRVAVRERVRMCVAHSRSSSCASSP